MSAVLFACSKCFSRHPFEELSTGQQLCKVNCFYYFIDRSIFSWNQIFLWGDGNVYFICQLVRLSVNSVLAFDQYTAATLFDWKVNVNARKKVYIKTEIYDRRLIIEPRLSLFVVVVIKCKFFKVISSIQPYDSDFVPSNWSNYSVDNDNWLVIIMLWWSMQRIPFMIYMVTTTWEQVKIKESVLDYLLKMWIDSIEWTKLNP